MKDIWQKMFEAANKYPPPKQISPFFEAYYVVAALEGENGKIYTGFCIEGCSGVLNLCAERMAAVAMINDGCFVVRRIMAFRQNPPQNGDGTPCGACREFFMQLAYENRNAQILLDYQTRSTVTLGELMPNWWGKKRYESQP